jgi:hypothetical protein
MNCKVSHIVVSSSRPKVSLSRICCRGQGHQHAFSVYNLQKIHSCRNRYHAVCAKMRDAASTDDGSRSLQIRSRDGGFNGASNHNSFNRLEADIAELALIRESDMRSKLVRKLSEANQHIRQLKKEVQEKDNTMFRCQSELSSMELELQV